jgi:MFS family permease
MRFRALARVRSSAVTAFGGLPGGFWWLWIGQLTNRAASFVMPLLAFYVTDELDGSAALAGAVVAAVGIGSLVSGPLGGVLADRLGHKPTLLGALGCTAVSIGALPYARTPWALLLGAFIVGVVSNATRPAFNALIAEVVPLPDQSRAYSLNFWAINIGYSVAMLSVALVSVIGYSALFWLDGATTLISAVLIAIMVKTPHARSLPADERSGEGIGAVLRNRTFLALVAAQFLVLSILAQSESGLPIAMANDGFSPSEFGRLAALNGIVIVVVQLPLTRYLGRLSESAVLAGSSAVIGIGYSVLLFGHSAWLYALSIVVWTLGEIGNTPTSIALVSRIAPAHLRGRYQGVYQVAWTGSAVLGPLIGGWTIYTWGATPLWIGCLVVGLATAVAQWRIAVWLNRGAAVPVAVRQEPESAVLNP